MTMRKTRASVHSWQSISMTQQGPFFILMTILLILTFGGFYLSNFWMIYLMNKQLDFMKTHQDEQLVAETIIIGLDHTTITSAFKIPSFKVLHWIKLENNLLTTLIRVTSKT